MRPPNDLQKKEIKPDISCRFGFVQRATPSWGDLTRHAKAGSGAD
jgi:hypothetical protein